MLAEKPYLELALGLIQREHYDEARTVLEKVGDHATAQKWLLWLEHYAPVPAWQQSGTPTLPEDGGAREKFISLAAPLAPAPASISLAPASFERPARPSYSQQLADLNLQIEALAATQQHNGWILAAGLVTLPALGAGVGLIVYAVMRMVRRRQALGRLRARRRALLADLEGRYSSLNTHAQRVRNTLAI